MKSNGYKFITYALEISSAESDSRASAFGSEPTNGRDLFYLNQRSRSNLSYTSLFRYRERGEENTERKRIHSVCQNSKSSKAEERERDTDGGASTGGRGGAEGESIG